MKYLVDTHILLWSFFEPEKLTLNIQEKLLDFKNEIYYSPVNLWEISIKYGLKKLSLKGLTPEDFIEELNNSYLLCKEIDNYNIITVYNLPKFHKDPFDRFLIWEAIRNNMTILTADTMFKHYTQFGLSLEI